MPYIKKVFKHVPTKQTWINDLSNNSKLIKSRKKPFLHMALIIQLKKANFHYGLLSSYWRSRKIKRFCWEVHSFLKNQSAKTNNSPSNNKCLRFLLALINHVKLRPLLANKEFRNINFRYFHQLPVLRSIRNE